MADIPNTRLFNFVDTPASVHYDQFGNAEVLLDPGGIIDVSGFRKMSLLIVSTRTNSFSVFAVSIRKIRNATAAEEFSQPVDGHTHTFEVVGPEMTLWLKGGKPNSAEKVQLWVYLRS